MKKRQFGVGREIYASDHNLAQNYTTYNLQEIVQDIGLYGIVTGGSITSANNAYNINISSTVCRNSTGDRINIPSSVQFDAALVSPILANQEVYITVYAIHIYNLSEEDIDSQDVVYYKDYADNYQILKIQGTVNTIGSAQPPAVPAGGVLLTDLLVNGTTTVITSNEIKTNRQIRFSDESGNNLELSGYLDVQGAIIGHGGLNLNSTTLSNVGNPTADSHVGSRGYNDGRYLQKTGGTVSGDLYGSRAAFTDLEATLLEVTGGSTLRGRITGENGAIITGNSRINGELSISQRLIGEGEANIDGRLTARSIFLEWYNNKLYQAGVIITSGGKLWQSKDTHTSNTDGVFINDISHWKLAGGGGSTTQDLTITSHGFSVGQVLYYNEGYYLADASDTTTLGLFIVSDVADVNNFTIMQTGYFKVPDGKNLSNALVSGATTFVPNAWYYLAENNPGKLTITSPEISNPILYSISTTEAYVVSYRPQNVATHKVYEFDYISGTSIYNLPFVAESKDSMRIVVGGVTQYNDDFDIVDNHLTLNTIYPDGIKIRVEYLVAMKYAPGAALEEYKFLTTEPTTNFTLTNKPASVKQVILTINGEMFDSDDYSIEGYDVVTNFVVPAGQKVRILIIQSARLFHFDAEYTLDNTIPGSKIINESVDGNKLINNSVGIEKLDDIQSVLTESSVNLPNSLAVVNYVKGIIGKYSYDNITVKRNASNPNYQVDIEWDELWIEGIQSTSGDFTLNITTSGLLGLDTGSEAISTWYYLWAIAKADGTVSVILSASATSPTMPSGYTLKRLVSMVRNNSSGDFVNFVQQDNQWAYVLEQTVYTSTSTTITNADVDVSQWIPLGVKKIFGSISVAGYKSSSGFDANIVLWGYINSVKSFSVRCRHADIEVSMYGGVSTPFTIISTNRKIYRDESNTTASPTGFERVIYLTGFEVEL